MNIPFIGEILKPIADTIDKLHTSTDEKLKAQALLEQIQNDLEKSVLEHRAKLVEESASVIKEEVKSESWLASNWRPILMMSFTSIIIFNYILFPIIRMFGVVAQDLPIPPELWSLLTIGVNGYLFTRSAEKILPDITKILKK